MGTSWDRVVALHARIEGELTRALAPHGLGLSEYRALRELAEAPGRELRMQNLAEAIGLNQSSVSRLAARMEAAGLTERCLCAEDRRGIYSIATDAGVERCARARAVYESTLAAALESAAGDPALASLVAVLR